MPGMSISPKQERGTKFRIGFSGNSQIRHVIDDWGPELVRRRRTVALCGTEVRPRVPGDQEDRLCKRCAQVIYQLDRDMYNRKNTPPDEAIIECMKFLREESQPKLAKVIPLLPRRRSN